MLKNKPPPWPASLWCHRMLHSDPENRRETPQRPQRALRIFHRGYRVSSYHHCTRALQCQASHGKLNDGDIFALNAWRAIAAGKMHRAVVRRAANQVQKIQNRGQSRFFKSDQGQTTVTPLQTNSVCPVTNPLRESQKKLTALATSSGVPIRCTGIDAIRFRVYSASGGLFCQKILVAIGPGATQFTVIW